MAETIIEVAGLSHSYGDLLAVDDVSFDVKKGDIFSFLGPNGAGKSTVINVLTTLLPLQKGEVTIAGYDLSREQARVRESIGIVFQEITLDRDMTVYETLEFHGRLYGMEREERHARIEELLSLVELEMKRDERTRDLSGGMKRRLEIARGLMTRPEVLFLDEPTIGLDPQTRIRMWEYLEDVNREGTSIFLTTHYMDEADRLSDLISIIDYGEIITTGRSWELKNQLGEDIIYLETDGTERTIELLSTEEKIREIRPKGKGIVASLNGDGTHILPQILLDLSEGGINVTTVNLKKPSMDDVFVHFTGREIRDDAAPVKKRGG